MDQFDRVGHMAFVSWSLLDSDNVGADADPHPKVAGNHPPLSDCTSLRLYDEFFHQLVSSLHFDAHSCKQLLRVSCLYIHLYMHMLQLPASE
jgi:hypothetical protein